MIHSHDLQVLSTVVAQHENDLQTPQIPLPGYAFTDIEQILWHYITSLRAEESRLLEKMAYPRHRLRLILHPSPTCRGIQLILDQDAHLLLKAGLLSVAHHGVQECFGCWMQQELYEQCQEHTQISWRSVRHPIDHRSRLLWRGLRWLCANLLLWKRPQLIFPDELDDRDIVLMP
jgi:hypothetical protein